MESDLLIQNKLHPILYAKDSILTPPLSTPSSLRELQYEIHSCPNFTHFHRDLSRKLFLQFTQIVLTKYKISFSQDTK